MMRPGSAAAPLRIAIFGAGGLGREILQALRDMQAAGAPVECAGFIVDPGVAAAESLHGLPVRRGLEALLLGDANLHLVVALGDPAARARIVQRVEAAVGPRFARVVHPRAWIGNTVQIGDGSMVLGLASVTTDVRLGRHVLVNPNASIAHDCVLEDFVTLAPAVALAGGVHLEEGCELGIGARVAPRLRLGRWSVVGAGAVVIRPTPSGATVVGVPARPLVRPPSPADEGAA